MLFLTTRLRADAVQATISTPTAIGLMASNGYHHYGCTSPAMRPIRQDIATAFAPATSPATINVTSDNGSTSSTSTSNSIASATSAPNNFNTVTATALASLTKTTDRLAVVYRTAQRMAVKFGVSMAAIGKQGLTGAMSALLALVALVLRRRNHKVANSDDDGALGGSVCRYEALSDSDDDGDDDVAAPDVVQETAVPEMTAPETVIHEAVPQEHVQEIVQETGIQAIAEKIVEKIVQEIFQEIYQKTVQETVQETGQKRAVQEHVAQDTTVQGSAESGITESTSVDEIDAITVEPTMTNGATTNSFIPEASNRYPAFKPPTSEFGLANNPTCAGPAPFAASSNMPPAAEFTFSVPGPAITPFTTAVDKAYTIPSFAADSIFGHNKLDTTGFTFTAAAKQSSAATGTSEKLTIAVPTSEFTFTGPTLEREMQSASSEESDSWSAGSFSPLFQISESSKRSSIVEIDIAKVDAQEEKRKEEERKKDEKQEKEKEQAEEKHMKENTKEGEEKKDSGKKSRNNKAKKQPTNKAAVWGGKKGKKGKKH